MKYSTAYIDVGIIVTIAFLKMHDVVADKTENGTVTMATIIREIFKGYDSTLPPNYDLAEQDRNNSQLTVAINVFVHSVFSVSETNMEYSISMFLRGRWVDERLKYNNTIKLARLELDKFYIEKVWMPDMYIVNEKESNFHEVTVPNKLIHIYENGTVQYSAKITGVFTCVMYLKIYPFDTQRCTLMLESYGHSTDTMNFIWNDGAVTVPVNIEFPQFSLVNFGYYNCEKVYYGIAYPCIGVSFILQRKYAYYILQVYLPSILTVSLSWVSFWLDYTAVPARITLGLLTVLTVTTQSSSARDNLPHVSYIKALDIYMTTCVTFVFCGFLEFAFVNVLARAEEKRRNKYSLKCKQEEAVFRKREKQTDHESSVSSKSGLSTKSTRPGTIDKISRVVFPVAFTIFNVIYWINFFVLEHNSEADDS